MSTEIKACVTVKNEPSWEEILLLRDTIKEWVNEYCLELEGLILELNGEKVYES